jgi:hypothetical protein
MVTEPAAPEVNAAASVATTHKPIPIFRCLESPIGAGQYSVDGARANANADSGATRLTASARVASNHQMAASRPKQY